MAEPLTGARTKLARATRHLDELRRSVQHFLEREPYRVERAETSEGEVVFTVRVNRDPDPSLGGIIGDVLHNLRSALDTVAWDMVLANGGSPNVRTAWPVADDRTQFYEQGPDRLAGASNTAWRLVRHLRPYEAGCRDLWLLHKLNILDKHRAIIPVGSAYRSVGVKELWKVPWQDEPVAFPSVFWKPKDRLFPLRDGVEIFRVRGARRDPDFAIAPPEFRFEVAFGDGEYIAGEPVVEWLERVRGVVVRVVELSARFVFADV